MVGSAGEMEEVRAELSARLRAHRLEMEEAILDRIRLLSSPPEAEDGEYVDGLRRAVSVSVADGFAGVEDGMGQVLEAQVVRFERLLATVEGERWRGPSEHRRLDRVKALLAGESVELVELAYELEDWHVGAIARGEDPTAALRSVAAAADRRLLVVQPQRGEVWAWFGGRRRVAMAEIARCVSAAGPGGTLVALGEPARGIEGWRLTHEQASAALRIARPGAVGVVRYADVGLLASIAQDRVLVRSLRQLYLTPLADGRDDGGAGLRETLNAYFRAGRNVSSAASALGVSRQTVGNRLRAIEERLGRTLESCAPEVEVALRLEGSGDMDRVDLSIRSDL